jgi:hypothetical protein
MRDTSERDAKSIKNGDRGLRFQSLCMAFSVTRKGDVYIIPPKPTSKPTDSGITSFVAS